MPPPIGSGARVRAAAVAVIFATLAGCGAPSAFPAKKSTAPGGLTNTGPRKVVYRVETDMKTASVAISTTTGTQQHIYERMPRERTFLIPPSESAYVMAATRACPVDHE
ncbi:hypothetical protein [Nonomuraea dietziae]|uniref:hypothetical protein n=1 Tax=Nonomuraea dietziae TaxID=65515 RepID=UPI003406A76B